MTILSWARVEIKVEISDKAVALSIVVPDTENLYVFVPLNIITVLGFYTSLAYTN